MTDAEYDILDELYFIKKMDELSSIFRGNDWNITEEVWKLIEKKWVKVLDEDDNELELTKETYLEHFKQLRFNATKKGLLAHNQI